MVKQNFYLFNYQRSLAQLKILSSAAALSLLVACGGSGAGDLLITPDDTETAGIGIEPFVGTWGLPGNWSGQENDEALLLIKSPGIDGIAEATIYDFDDAATGLGTNCYRADFPIGKVSQSLANTIFLDDLNALPNGEISLSDSGNLVIIFSDDISSTDRETTTIVAIRLEITEADITPLCDI